jgi:pyruvate dehydrogenase E2 component (dihydrolipoamide acetyltransferase)
MPSAIAMPKLGMAMKEGTVLEWLARPGDAVARGQIVLRIESEKTEVDVESPASGVLRHVYVAPDCVVPCGTFLAAITDSAGEAFDAEAFRKENERAEKKPPTKSPTPPTKPPTQSGGVTSPPVGTTSLPRPAEPPVVPAARKRAKDLDVDLARVTGSGPNGRITVEDVEAYAASMGERVEVAPGVKLEVPSHGSGEPVLILPGFGTHVSAFGHQANALATTHLVRGVNPRGIGFSSAPASERYDVPTAAADVAAVAGDPAHLVGASLGAAVALELALARPELVRSLVLITPFTRATPRLLAVLDAWAKLAAEAPADALAAALLPWLYGPGLLADTAGCRRTLRALAEMSAHAPAATLRRQEAGLRAWSGTRENDLGRVRARTLVIAAEHDLLAPDGAEIAKRIPGARLLVVASAGHAVAIDGAETVSAAIAAHVSGG